MAEKLNLFSVAELAELLGKTRAGIHYLIDQGHFSNHVKVGRALVIPAEDVETYIDEEIKDLEQQIEFLKSLELRK